MSVIAKLEARDLRDFGSGQLIEFSCVCENDLMAEYAESEEDRLFTRYSPWGEARVHTQDSAAFGKIVRGDKFYAVLARRSEAEGGMPGALLRGTARIAGLTNHGDGQAQTVEICGPGDQAAVETFPTISNFTWRMSVDNEGATRQFEPGKGDYVIGFFPAAQHDRDSAIAAAHAVS